MGIFTGRRGDTEDFDERTSRESSPSPRLPVNPLLFEACPNRLAFLGGWCFSSFDTSHLVPRTLADGGCQASRAAAHGATTSCSVASRTSASSFWERTP